MVDASGMPGPQRRPVGLYGPGGLICGRARRCLLLIVLLALALRLWGLNHGLPDMSHADETEVVNHAVRFGSGDLNPHRFQYGSLFQYLLFVCYGVYFAAGWAFGLFAGVHDFALAFIADPTVFYLVARGLSALFGTATVVLVYRMGKMACGEEAGLLGALFLACCYPHVVHSHYCTVDVALTFVFTLAVLQCMKLLDTRRLGTYLLAGFLIGLSIAVKFNGVFAYAAFFWAHMLNGARTGLYARMFDKKFWMGTAAVLVGHFAGCPFFYAEMGGALEEIANLRAMHAFEGLYLFEYLQRIGADYWGVALGAVCLVGLLRPLATANRKLMVMELTVMVCLVFAAKHRFVEAKYILYVMPLIAVCGAGLFHECFRMRRWWGVGVLLALLLYQPLALIVTWDSAHARKSIDTEAREWIETHIPAGTRVLLDNVGNQGPKLHNTPANLRRQYDRAVKHKLMKAEYLQLKLQLPPGVCYDIVQVNEPAGFRADDYQRYRLWQDLEDLGFAPEYYNKKKIRYIIITQRYFPRMRDGFHLVKEFIRGRRGIRIYRVPSA